MRYLCLIYNEERILDTMPDHEIEAVANECLAHCETLKESGHLITSARLGSVQTATTVRARNGRPLVTDGPFAETKEQLGGFYLIEARDLNEAIRIASNLPPGRLGCVEVRPISDQYPQQLSDAVADL
ncbi:YciI family protein [Litchfieldella rifensis]|uniref:YciI family protein n=1 Tax=Litchfieldella rifensis TaxID=762643 RepID=A0ABV7LQZ3_9GAMM